MTYYNSVQVHGEASTPATTKKRSHARDAPGPKAKRLRQAIGMISGAEFIGMELPGFFYILVPLTVQEH